MQIKEIVVWHDVVNIVNKIGIDVSLGFAMKRMGRETLERRKNEELMSKESE